MPLPDDLLEALQARHTLEACQFADLLGTLYTLRFTGKVELDFCNGRPQAAYLGKPAVVRFPEHPANNSAAGT